MPNNAIDIPEIQDINVINRGVFERFQRAGVCYIKIPSQDTAQALLNLISVGRAFFTSQNEQKKKFYIDEPSSELGKKIKILSEGYTDRNTHKSRFETYRQRVGDDELPLFINNASDLKLVKENIIDTVILKLILELSNSLNFSDIGKASLDKNINDAKAWLQLTYYQERNFFEKLSRKPGLHPHKDISLITIISNDKPGLCLWQDGVWRDVPPREGYLIALFGRLANVITEGKVNSPLHTVKDVHGSRLSAVFFFAGKAASEVHTMNGKMLADSLVDYGAVLEKKLVERRESADLFVKKMHLALNCIFVFGFLFKVFSNSFEKSFASQLEESFSLASFHFIVLNLTFLGLNEIYFKKISLDYLQYADTPNYATEPELNAYNLGKSSTTFFGMIGSFIDKSAYTHRSYWNAGFLSSLLGK